MKKRRIGVNIDHVATIRNARNEKYPDPLRAALVAQKSGADSVTIHLREDRRHIRDEDLRIIKNKLKIPLNLEIAPTKEMLNIALKHKPNYICIVPEKRAEITTEGGLNLNSKKKFIKDMIKKFKKKKIRVSLFVEPTIQDIIISKKLGADCVEIHTGKYCNAFNKNKNVRLEYLKIKRTSYYAKKLNLEVHAGHGLTYKSTSKISKIKYISEFNIGHFLVSESIFLGLNNTIKKIKKIITK